ncbi:MAG: thioredoxin family protein [Hydrogenophilaceae bacterium]|nr:thioredoxin family protein [Hydrogenophilaceae bacterium]
MTPIDEFGFHAKLRQTAGNALVLFSGPDCGNCRQAERRLPAAAGPGIALFKVDVQKSTALARQYEVFHLPTLFLFRDGHYHAKLECEVTPDKLRQAIESALARPPEEEP